MVRLPVLFVGVALWGFVGCGPLTKPNATAPADLVCARILVASDDLAGSLASAQGGDCVLLGDGTWRGNFVVPQDVSVVAGVGATAVLRGTGAGQPVLTVRGGSRTVIRGIKIDVSAGGGIVVEPGPVNMLGVSVTGTAQAGLTSSCAETDCDQRPHVVKDCEFGRNHTGVILSGATTQLTGTRIFENAGTGLTDGNGLVVANGAVLDLADTTVEDNANVGLLIDGAKTRAQLTRATVRRNAGRGVWVQNVTGTDTVHVTGGDFSGNTLVGLGTVSAEGVVVSDSSITETKKVSVVIDLGHTAQIGDGVGLFKGTKSTTLSGVTLANNQRAQLLVDAPGTDVHASALTVTAPDGGYRLVVQHAASTVVDVPAELTDSPAQPLQLVDSAVSVQH